MKKKKTKELLKKQAQKSEKDGKKEIIKKVVVSIHHIVLVLLLAFLFDAWRFAMIEHDPKSIRICYILYALSEAVAVHLFILKPNYRSKYGSEEAPKSLVHSMIIIAYSAALGVMTRFLVNDLNIEIWAVALNVCILDYTFYRFENKSISKFERKNQSVLIGVIIFRIFKICIEILFALFLINYPYNQIHNKK